MKGIRSPSIYYINAGKLIPKANKRMSKNSRTTIPHAVYDTHNQESSIPEIAEYPTIIKRHDMVADY